MKRSAFTDTALLDASSDLHETKDGYLTARPRIARTGIQLYQGHELGRPDLKEVRVYWSESEVMSRDSVTSLAGKPVTIEHPRDPVTAKNWKDHAVGHVGDEILRDGEFIRVPLHLMDSAAVTEVRKGRSQLSVGYTAMLQWGDGVTDKGEAYDVKQTSIRANHVAITHTARGGDKLRMGDNKEKTMRKFMVDGIAIEVEDRDAQIIERHIDSLTKDLATAKNALATAQTSTQNDLATARTETANAKAEVQTKDAEIATLKKQLGDAVMSPQKLDELVSNRAKTVMRAKSIIGDALVVDGKTDAEMRKQVVLAKMGDTAKDWNDDMITASFNTLAVSTADTGNGNGLQQIAQVLLHNDNSGDPRVKAYSQYEQDLSNRWKTAGARTQ